MKNGKNANCSINCEYFIIVDWVYKVISSTLTFSTEQYCYTHRSPIWKLLPVKPSLSVSSRDSVSCCVHTWHIRSCYIFIVTCCSRSNVLITKLKCVCGKMAKLYLRADVEGGPIFYHDPHMLRKYAIRKAGYFYRETKLVNPNRYRQKCHNSDCKSCSRQPHVDAHSGYYVLWTLHNNSKNNIGQTDQMWNYAKESVCTFALYMQLATAQYCCYFYCLTSQALVCSFVGRNLGCVSSAKQGLEELSTVYSYPIDR